VLIIDDDKEILEMYKYKFEKEGFEVKTEENGLMGVTSAVEFKPDVVLMDLMMPQMDGFESIHAFRENTDMDVAIVVLSNLSQNDKKKYAEECGADGYLVKADYTPAEIVERVQEILNEKKCIVSLYEYLSCKSISSFLLNVKNVVRANTKINIFGYLVVNEKHFF
jgi:DNA-binding response OmpR family regulator